MSRIHLVTGANGFLGNTVVKKLEQRGERVRALVLPGSDRTSLQGTSCEVVEGDITVPESLKPFFRQEAGEEQVVMHCAAYVYIRNRQDPRVFRVNVDGTVNVAEECLKTGARMVCVNSVHALPEPEDDREIVETGEFSPDRVVGIYAKSKAEAARRVLSMVRVKGLQAVLLHPSGIIGPGDYGDTHLTAMIRAVMNRRLPAVVKGGYDFVDVRDVADGVIAAGDRGAAGESYILSNRYIPVRELTDLACDATESRRISLVAPMPLARAVAPMAEWLGQIRRKTPLLTRYSLYTLQARSNFSHSKAERELGFQPRSLKQTVEDMVRWLSSRTLQPDPIPT